MEAQEFAQDHYNMDRDAFYKHAATYQWHYSIRCVRLTHTEEIQTDMALFDDAMEQYVEDPESHFMQTMILHLRTTTVTLKRETLA